MRNSSRTGGDNARAVEDSACAQLDADRRERPRIRVVFRFFPIASMPVNTQQIPARPRKSLTLLQMLGLIGGIALIVAIVLNQFV